MVIVDLQAKQDSSGSGQKLNIRGTSVPKTKLYDHHSQGKQVRMEFQLGRSSIIKEERGSMVAWMKECSRSGNCKSKQAIAKLTKIVLDTPIFNENQPKTKNWMKLLLEHHQTLAHKTTEELEFSWANSFKEQNICKWFALFIKVCRKNTITTPCQYNCVLHKRGPCHL